jgi:hypothetical protein
MMKSAMLMLPKKNWLASDACSALWGSSSTRKSASSTVAGKNRLTKAKRSKTLKEILGISAFKNLDLKPSGMTIREKISRSVIVKIQSLLLGKVEKDCTRRDLIRRTSSFSEGIMTFTR